ncbi:hypothetical protein NX059_007434 [Plenodomus lindquistii]|nr:hypothetical protein NX059_007434 [Plenodomus lindquistii]
MAEPIVEQRRDASIPQYLNLNRLSLSQLPPHPDIPASDRVHQVGLSQFLNILIAEVGRVDLNQDTTDHGIWAPKDHETKLSRNICMPPPSVYDLAEPKSSVSRNENPKLVKVPIEVRKWVKRMNNTSWLGRSSRHPETTVRYEELDGLLSRDHGHKEARYTPNLYDTNELLSWSTQDLDMAVAELACTPKAESAQMSIFQMFHKMPAIAGLNILNDRVFHVLIVTLHSRFVPFNHDGVGSRRRSVTVQVPIDFESFSNVESIMRRSHLTKKGSSMRYEPRSSPQGPITATQEKRKGNKLIEGNYVSVEHVHEASMDWDVGRTDQADPTTADVDYCHSWRMMTLSEAGGVTRHAPQRSQVKETLEAIAGDVYKALECIQTDRLAKLGMEPHERDHWA